ncbi:MAG: DUF4091 domain-containing protein [Acidobacteria bacterium]|nr:DUF4091 domain-containing protein [Acidobacteriota bacterium]
MLIRLQQILLFSVLIADALIFPAFFANRAKAQDLNWWTTHALIKVRPNDAPPAGNMRGAELFAGRNEFESFQIVLRSDRHDVEKVDLQISDLRESSGSSIASKNVTIYLERYLKLEFPSSAEGGTGEWPDPLIPRIDRYAGEKRNAFPFSLLRSRNQPLWIEVYVPPDTVPGVYSGKATITAHGLPDISVPIRLTVWDFVLPSTSSLKTSFGLNGVTALKQHRGRYTDDEELHDITYLYAKAALWHRISIHGGNMAPPPFSEGMRLDWSWYDQEVGPFLDGKVFSKDEPLFGARATTVEIRTHKTTDTNEKKLAYWREWVEHFAEKGWLDRLFYYVWDEPPLQNYPQVAERATLARRADARIRNLVTTSLDDSLKGVINIWAPLINCIDPKPGFGDYCEGRAVRREVYEAEIEQGKGLWWYQSCASHGCSKGSGGDYFRGWPSYAVDVSAVANRIMPWLAWKYKVEGELYFSMNEAFAHEIDPWESIYLFGGNGDGTLFYPGRSKQIGGSTDIPVESIRLKLIREGLEDYEYLVLLSQQRFSDFADKQVSQMVTRVYQWERDPEKLYAVRRELGERLERQRTAERLWIWRVARLLTLSL